MRNFEVTHVSGGADCVALAPGEYAIRLRARRGRVKRAVVLHTFNKYNLHLGVARADMPLALRDSDFDYFALTLRGDDCRLAYVFELTDDKGKVWYLSEEGVSAAYDWRYAYFSHFQYPYSHACDRHKEVSWAKDAVFYQIFPERFCAGVGDKRYVTADWYDEPTPKAFYGGDLWGVRDKLDYLQDLGVTCLYLTPIHPSVSNHKYDIIDYYGVDAMFGGEQAFKALIAGIKKRGMRLILDGVFNHCSEKCALFEDVKARGRQSPYHGWFFIDGDVPDAKKGNYQTFASVSYMPRLNTGHPEVIRYFCYVARYWIEEYGISGWRLDVCDELSDDFLRALRKAVKSADPDAVLIGEVWHESARWLRGDMLDGVMNYGLTKACLDYLAFGVIDANTFRDRLCRLLWRNTDATDAMMLNLMGSHDTDRFFSCVNENENRLLMAYAVAFFFPGMPCVYYGDEVGVTGGYDPGCRKGFPWDEARQNARIREGIQALTRLKSDEDFISAAFSVDVENGVPRLRRVGKENVYTLYLNPAKRLKYIGAEGEKRVLPSDHYHIDISPRKGGTP